MLLKLKSIYFLVLLLFISNQGYTQYKKVANILFRTIDDKIEIFYDLPENTDTLDVKIYFCKKSDSRTRYRLKRASGNIGIGVFSGRKQKVIWDYKKEPPYLFTGSGFYYKIFARKFTPKKG